jgi:hypothetical protein
MKTRTIQNCVNMHVVTMSMYIAIERLLHQIKDSGEIRALLDS